MCLPNATPPCFSCIYFLNGERVLHLQGHLTMTESRLVAILAKCYLLLKCQLAVLSCRLACVACILLTSMHHTSHTQPCYHHRAKGCRQESAGSGRLSEGRKCLSFHRRFYELGSPVQNLTSLKFQTLKFSFSYSKLHHLKISRYTVGLVLFSMTVVFLELVM